MTSRLRVASFDGVHPYINDAEFPSRRAARPRGYARSDNAITRCYESTDRMRLKLPDVISAEHSPN